VQRQGRYCSPPLAVADENAVDTSRTEPVLPERGRASEPGERADYDHIADDARNRILVVNNGFRWRFRCWVFLVIQPNLLHGLRRERSRHNQHARQGIFDDVMGDLQ
jgi:hypothetical protein